MWTKYKKDNSIIKRKIKTFMPGYLQMKKKKIFHAKTFDLQSSVFTFKV